MLRRLQMLREVDVRRPWKLGRILRPADHKSQVVPECRRPQKELRQRILPIGRIGPQIRQRRAEPLHRTHTMMQLGIDPAIQRCNLARSQPARQLLQCTSSRIAQHQVEPRKPRRRKVAHGAASAQAVERHRRVHVVERAYPRTGVEDQLRGGRSVRAEARADRHVRLRQLPPRPRRDLGERAIQMQARAIVQPPQIARIRVVGNVSLEEGNRMAAPCERTHQRTPERRVPVAPRRGDRQPEDNNMHPVSHSAESAARGFSSLHARASRASDDRSETWDVPPAAGTCLTQSLRTKPRKALTRGPREALCHEAYLRLSPHARATREKWAAAPACDGPPLLSQSTCRSGSRS